MFQVLFVAGQAVLMWILPRLLGVLGATAISAAVFTPIFDWLHGQINQKIGGIGADAANFLEFCGVPAAISIVFAAYSLAVSIKAAKASLAKKSAS